MNKENYYEILGVDKEASQEDIKKSYRKLVQELHPDKNQDNPEAEEKIKKVNEAYQTLSNPERRAAYDSPAFSFNNSDFDIGEILRNMSGNFKRSHYGNEYSVGGQIKISLKDVLVGLQNPTTVTGTIACGECAGSCIDIKIQPIKCEKCDGKGQFQINKPNMKLNVACNQCKGKGNCYSPCKVCDGLGYQKHREEVIVTVPIGIPNNVKIQTPLKNGSFCYVGIVYDLPKDLEIDDGGNILEKEYIDFSTLVLGGTITKTLFDDSVVTVKIPENTNPDKLIKLKGKGLPSQINNAVSRADYYLMAKLKMPTDLTEEQKKNIESIKYDEKTIQTK